MFYSRVELYGNDYILVMNSIKITTEWFLYSTIHPDDYIASLQGETEFKHKIINEADLYLDKHTDYLVEAIKVKSSAPQYVTMDMAYWHIIVECTQEEANAITTVNILENNKQINK